MTQMRDMVLSEAQVDRAVAALRRAEVIIAEGWATGSDMSPHEERLDDLREEIRCLEAILAEREVAAGLDPRPMRDLCPMIDQHLRDIGLEVTHESKEAQNAIRHQHPVD